MEGKLNHKEEYELDNGTTLYIAKEYENNLLERNCQIGYIRGIPEDNPYNLKIGDEVFVHHMVFFGEIAEHTKSYTYNPDHFPYDDKLLFKCELQDMYFKLNGEEIIPLGDILLMDPIVEEDIRSGIYLGEVKHKDIAKVINGNGYFNDGEILFVEKNSLYPITINKQKYFRLRANLVMGVTNGDELIPTKGRIVVKDIVEERTHSFLDLSMMKEEKFIKAKVIATSGVRYMNKGDIILRAKSGGLVYKDKIVLTVEGDLNEGSVYGKFTEPCRLTEA